LIGSHCSLLERGKALLWSGVDGENHSLLAMVGLQAEEPEGIGVNDLETPRREGGLICHDGHEA